MKEEANIPSLPHDIILLIALMSIRPTSVGSDLRNVISALPWLNKDLKQIILTLAATKLYSFSFKPGEECLVQSSPKKVLEHEFRKPRTSEFWRPQLTQKLLPDFTTLWVSLDQYIINCQYKEAVKYLRIIDSLDVCNNLSKDNVASEEFSNRSRAYSFLLVMFFDKLTPEEQEVLKPVFFENYSDEIMGDRYERTLKYLEDLKDKFISTSISMSREYGTYDQLTMERVVEDYSRYIKVLNIYFGKEVELESNLQINTI